MSSTQFSRRSFLAMSAVLPWAFRSAAAARSIPVGLELYSVRQALKQDPEGTLRAVAKMGYRAVEFYAPYFEWTDAQAKQMRKVLDQLRCPAATLRTTMRITSARRTSTALAI